MHIYVVGTQKNSLSKHPKQMLFPMDKKIFIQFFNLPLLVLFSHECCLSVPISMEQGQCCCLNVQ